MLVQREAEEAEQAEWGSQRWEGPGSPIEGRPQKKGPGALEDTVPDGQKWQREGRSR